MYKYKIRRLLKRKLGCDYVENISSGKFSDVVLLKLPSGERKAVKIVSGGQIKQPQIDIWPLLDHENIIRLENTILMPDIDACCFVMTPQYTTLENIVQSDEFRSDEFNVFSMKRWLLDTLSGTSYLHRKNVCHLNITASNILISYDSRAKLEGFGLVTSSTAPVSGCGIEFPYNPPELCYSRTRDNLVDPIGVDLWSLGIMTLKLFTQNMLEVELGNNVKMWSTEVYKKIFKEIKELKWNIQMSFPEMQISSEDLKRLKNFIRMFLSLKPGDRPSAELAMEHRFLSRGLFMPKVDPAWKRKAETHSEPPHLMQHVDVVSALRLLVQQNTCRVNIEMIIEEHNTLDNVRKRCEGRDTPGNMNPSLKPHARHQLITLSESNKGDQHKEVRFVKSEEVLRTDVSEERKKILEKALAVHSEAKISAWDRVEMPVVQDCMRDMKINNSKESRAGGKNIASQRNPEKINQGKPGTPEKKRKPGILSKAKTWFVGKLRSFQKF